MSDGPALVVGGSRGIGRAVVETLVAAGRTVAFTWATREEDARTLAESSQERARPFRFDLHDRDAAATLLVQVEEAVGPLAALVDNAGVRRDALLSLMSDDDWDWVVDANLGGVFRVCRAALPGMLRRRCGAIVNVSSLSALHGVPGQAAYAASKAGIIGLTRALARECGKRGVRVNAIVPGYVPTDFVADLPAPLAEQLRAAECLKEGVTPRAVAGAVAFLLSDGAAAITGQAIVVDAGCTA